VGAAVASAAGSLLAGVAVGVATGQKVGAALLNTVKSMAQSFAVNFVAVSTGFAELIENSISSQTAAPPTGVSAETVPTIANAGSTTDSPARLAADDAQKMVDKAYEGITERTFSSRDQAAKSLHKIALTLDGQMDREVYASIYRVGSGRSAYYVVGRPVVGEVDVVTGQQQRGSQARASIGRNQLRRVASWHTHPSTISPGFSSRFTNGHPADIEGYIDSRTTGYVSNLENGSLVKFDEARYFRQFGVYGGETREDIKKLTCVLSGSNPAFSRC
jgi:hypothetical protein